MPWLEWTDEDGAGLKTAEKLQLLEKALDAVCEAVTVSIHINRRSGDHHDDAATVTAGTPRAQVERVVFRNRVAWHAAADISTGLQPKSFLTVHDSTDEWPRDSDDPPRTGSASNELMQPQETSVSPHDHASLARAVRIVSSASVSPLHNPCLRAVLNSSPLGVFTTLPDAKVEWAASQLEQSTGLSLQDMAGEGWVGAVHRDDLALALQAREQGLTTGTFPDIEVRLRGPASNGDAERIGCTSATPESRLQAHAPVEHAWRYYLCSCKAIRDPDSGEILRWIGILCDIHKRRMLEQNLAAEKALFVTAIDQLPVAVAVVEAPSGIPRLANKRTYELWRTDRLASSFDEYNRFVAFHPDGSRFAPEDWPLARSILRGEAVVKEDARFQRGDGTFGIVRLASLPVRDETGRIIAGVGTCEDVTELLETQEIRARLLAAEQSTAQMSQLVSNVSHELRTPLHGILGMAELLGSTELGEEQREYVSAIASSGRLLLAVIGDLLDHEKMRAGKLTLEALPFSLLAVIVQVKGMLSDMARKKGVSMVSRIQPDLPPGWGLSGDAQRFKQLLLNLLSNAVRFTPSGGRVELTGSVELLPEAAELAGDRETADSSATEAVSQAAEVQGVSETTDSSATEAVSQAAVQSSLHRVPSVASHDSVAPPAGAATDPSAAHSHGTASPVPTVTSASPLPHASRVGDGAAVASGRPPLIPRASPASFASSASPVQGISAPTAGLVHSDAGSATPRSVHSIASAVPRFAKSTGKTSLTIRAASPQPRMARVRLAVIDTGIGLDEDTRVRLFKPWTQADSSTTRRYGGTGLGLAICRELTSLMGGNIKVESDGPGKGSTFRIEVDLPACPPGRMHDALATGSPSMRLMQYQGEDVAAYGAAAAAAAGDGLTPSSPAPAHAGAGTSSSRMPTPVASRAVAELKASLQLAAVPLPKPVSSSRLQMARALRQQQRELMASGEPPEATNTEGTQSRQQSLPTEASELAVSVRRPPLAASLPARHAALEGPQPLTNRACVGSTGAADTLAGVGALRGPTQAVFQCVVQPRQALVADVSHRLSMSGPGSQHGTRPRMSHQTVSSAPQTVCIAWTATAAAAPAGAAASEALQEHVDAAVAADAEGQMQANEALPRNDAAATRSPATAVPYAAGVRAVSTAEAPEMEPAVIAGTTHQQRAEATASQERMNPRVLLVEDTAVNALLAKRMLRSGGITDVTHVENGELAVAAVRDGEPYDVVLMDCQMPVLDGYEATRRIRALPDPVRSRVPIVALTASALQADIDRSHGVGMNDHLPKPHSAAALIEVVRKWALPAVTAAGSQ